MRLPERGGRVPQLPQRPEGLALAKRGLRPLWRQRLGVLCIAQRLPISMQAQRRSGPIRKELWLVRRQANGCGVPLVRLHIYIDIYIRIYIYCQRVTAC
jgi:hypothetical protein